MDPERVIAECARVTDELGPGSVSEVVAELLGVDASPENEQAMVKAMDAAQTALLKHWREGSSSVASAIGSGFAHGVAFAVAVRNVIEREAVDE